MKLYGIPNCNTVKKARTWLEQHGKTIEFHDFKKAGVTEAMLQGWIKKVGWEKLVNRQGTTWRKLDEDTKAGVTDAKAAISLMIEKPSVIKRPVIEVGDTLCLGFDENEYTRLFK